MKIMYVVRAIGTRRECIVMRHFAFDSSPFISRRKLEKACREDLLNSSDFDALLTVHVSFSLRYTLMKWFDRRRFLKTFSRVEKW